MFSFFSILLVHIASALALPLRSSSPTASIDSGVIIGTTTTIPSSNVVVEKYLGVPFADSPTRFEPPNPVKPWPAPYKATKWGPGCIQEIEESDEVFYGELGILHPEGGESEDCLNLNIFTPASTPDSTGSRTVLVWIYGGGYVNGASSLSIYDGSSFAAEQDVVVVTINYRTNVFGFPGGDVPMQDANLG